MIWFVSITLIFLLVCIIGYKYNAYMRNKRKQRALCYFAMSLGMPCHAYYGHDTDCISSFWDDVEAAPELKRTLPEQAKEQLFLIWGIRHPSEETLRAHMLDLFSFPLTKQPSSDTDCDLLVSMAMDIAHTAQFIHLSALANYLTKEEAWGWLFLNAKRATECFDCWCDYLQYCLKGIDYYYASTHPRMVEQEQRVHIENEKNDSWLEKKSVKRLQQFNRYAVEWASKRKQLQKSIDNENILQELAEWPQELTLLNQVEASNV